MSQVVIGPISWERMMNAVEGVRQRLLKATQALEAGGVPYAVIGGNAVAAWVSRVDEDLVRNTKDVDILIRRTDLNACIKTLEAAGFKHEKSFGVDLFLDGTIAKPSRAVHLLFAQERVKDGDTMATPDVADSEQDISFRIINLDALVRMKLVANRDHDRTHLRDLMRAGLIDRTWLNRVPAELVPRLQYVLDTPDG
jgi:hypothetical protein